ncbi:hypothetical protein FRX31_020748 [Thalictrum thalictroides]|uniref:Uncharacterized protein n=1 Tax=Thalictrum thalictroides TaxID=46969 RepID=A0A7J6W012_THATH|nr:hypothetical protein FRX31_020748 [Thalictrum thalictroides]
MHNELSLSNIGNVDKNVITEVEEASSDQDEDDLIADSNVELTSSLPCDDKDDVVDDQAGPSSVPDDKGDDIKASVNGRLSEAAMKLTRK